MLAKIIGVFSSNNSAITCLHPPQGVTGLSHSATTAIQTISAFEKPLEYRLNKALLSAQLDKGYDEFSILQPRWYLPSVVKIAEPTLNFEYGAYEFYLAAIAISIIFSTS